MNNFILFVLLSKFFFSILNFVLYSGAIDGFNMAQAGTKTFNLSSQAKKLVSEMRRNPNVDFKYDWKMVTVLVGKAYLWLTKVNLRTFLFYVFKFVQ